MPTINPTEAVQDRDEFVDNWYTVDPAQTPFVRWAASTRPDAPSRIWVLIHCRMDATGAYHTNLVRAYQSRAAADDARSLAEQVTGTEDYDIEEVSLVPR